MGGRLNGMHALVTGGAVGLGRHYALSLAREGCDVAIVDMRSELSESAALIRETGSAVIPLYADVRNANEAQTVCTAAIDQLGWVDILINNAGICRHSYATDTLKHSLDDYEAIIGTNLRAPFMFGRLLAKHMAQRGTGHIINVATDHVHTFPGRSTNGFGSMDLYDCSKWGLVGLTLGWAKALQPHGIRVNAFSMDATDSPMLRSFAGPHVSDAAKARWMNPDAVCSLAVDLIAQGKHGCTGQNFGIWCDFEIKLTHYPRPLRICTDD